MQQNNKQTYHTTKNKNHQGFLQGIHHGFNYFHQIPFPPYQENHFENKKQFTIHNGSTGFGLKRLRIKTLGDKQSESIHISAAKKGENRNQQKSRKKLSKSMANDKKYLTLAHSRRQNQNESQMAPTLRENKFRLDKLKTQVNNMREQQFNDYIKKSIRYQGLLEINDNKKKRLPTLNTKIGEVVKKSLNQMSNKQIIYDVTFISLKLQGWKPESREGHTCIQYGKDSVIMIGGHCSHPFNKANIYSLEKNNWAKSIETNTARSYHTSVIYKNNYVITFGGMGVYNASRKCRECFNTISLIDLKNLTSKIIRMTNQESVEPRRSHSSTLMGKYMMVFGGMNTKKQYLNDFLYLDIKDLRWAHKEYKVQGTDLETFLNNGLAKHKGYCYFKARKSYPLYHAQYTDQQGLYFFGGTNQEGTPSVILQIAFNRYVPVLRRVSFTGKSPSSIDPIVEKYNEHCVIIVSGDQYQREITIYNFKQQKFTPVKFSPQKPLLGGLGSTLIFFKSCFYVFYGLGKQGYIGTIGSFYVTERVQDIQNKSKKQKIQYDWRNFLAAIDNSSIDSWQGVQKQQL